MNILGDFINRVNALYPPEIENDELNALLTTIRNQGDEIEMKDKEITRLKARLEKLEPKEAKKPAAKKAAVKRGQNGTGSSSAEREQARPKVKPAAKKAAPKVKPAAPKAKAEPKPAEAPKPEEKK